ncbi:hypothetical protein AB0B86_02090 [Micromonospora sp. NPDC049047]|uniref:hypothetical protein n=1 Tax=Micromonospora sp. NPDC049047 TaxID=3155645 RepID=UPI0033ECA0A3
MASTVMVAGAKKWSPPCGLVISTVGRFGSGPGLGDPLGCGLGETGGGLDGGVGVGLGSTVVQVTPLSVKVCGPHPVRHDEGKGHLLVGRQRDTGQVADRDLTTVLLPARTVDVLDLLGRVVQREAQRPVREWLADAQHREVAAQHRRVLEADLELRRASAGGGRREDHGENTRGGGERGNCQSDDPLPHQQPPSSTYVTGSSLRSTSGVKAGDAACPAGARSGRRILATL